MCVLANVPDPDTAKVDPRPAKGGWRPGNFLNECSECGDLYIGHKRSMHCGDCAYGRYPENYHTAPGVSRVPVASLGTFTEAGHAPVA